MKCYVIAEAGVNHNGSEQLALELVDAAAASGADAVKFQTFRAKTLVAKGTATADYQKKQTGSSDQYAMLKQLEMSEDLHQKLIVRCQQKSIEFMSTPFDIEAAEFLLKLGMKRIKVPSGELTNLPLIRGFTAFNKPMILSTGMASLDEVREAVVEVENERKIRGFVEPMGEVLTILHCTSNYPAKIEDVNLKAMQTMADVLCLPIGYSDHTDGIFISVAAVAMGATIIEKHFTLDRNLPGPDQKASLEPDELALMVKQIHQVETSLGDGVKTPRSNELPVRALVRRSVTLVNDKTAGSELRAEDLVLLRPGTGIPPKQLQDVIGKRLKSAQKAGMALSWENFI
ncbi:MAG: N-acetylneuraminate synthase [Paraglaciecola sp.]|jgi:N-acetylneuraminate synthase